jgi:hypothetical protein
MDQPKELRPGQLWSGDLFPGNSDALDHRWLLLSCDRFSWNDDRDTWVVAQFPIMGSHGYGGACTTPPRYFSEEDVRQLQYVGHLEELERREPC